MSLSRDRVSAAFLATFFAAAVAAAGEHELHGVVDLRLVATGAGRGWLDGGLDKRRFTGGDRLRLGGLLLDYRGRFTPLLGAHVTAAAYDGVDEPIDLLEAYLELHPVPRSEWRLRSRLGIFYPPVSLTSSGPAWSNADALSFSAIDSWIGEEVRGLGVEVEVTRMGRFVGSSNDWSLVGALFRDNDPAGALLSWRGWALGDRQTGWFERLDLPALPAFGPGGPFPPQSPWEEPFVELDGRLGGYVGIGWDWLDRSRLRLLRYDNRGDPGVIGRGQWAWRTRFDHLGWRLRPSRTTDLVVQLLSGETEMDGFTGPLVYVEMRAGSLLVTRAWGARRATLRFDRFEVADEDGLAVDPNGEEGHAWTAAYLVSLGGGPDSEAGPWRIVVELQRLVSDRPARLLLGESSRRVEESAQLSLQLRF